MQEGEDRESLEVAGSGTRGRVVGSCYGFGVVSPLPLRYLRGGSGAPLEVTEDEPGRPEPQSSPPLLSWTKRPDNPFTARLRQLDGWYSLYIDNFGEYRICKAGNRILVPPGPAAWRREHRLWGVPTVLALITRGDVAMHAVAVEVEGRALVIAAPGRHGKTTLATRFLQRGHRVLSEDLVCCRLASPPLISPGPSLLRLREESRAALGDLPATTPVGHDADSTHFSIDKPMRGCGHPVPLSGIVLLYVRDHPPELRRVPAAESLQGLWSVTFNVPDSRDRARCFSDIAELARVVPVWSLSRRLLFEELDGVIDSLIDQCLR